MIFAPSFSRISAVFQATLFRFANPEIRKVFPEIPKKPDIRNLGFLQQEQERMKRWLQPCFSGEFLLEDYKTFRSAPEERL